MSIHPQQRSEVARLREQIAREHEAACRALTSPAIGTAQHWFITRRMERIEQYQQQLSTLVGEQESIAFLVEIFDHSPTQLPEGERGCQHR